MSLEEELMAATQGGFTENRPPLNFSSDPDLIVGIVDDRLVKVLPDSAARAKGADGFHIPDCDEYSTDELDVEIIEAFPEKPATDPKEGKTDAANEKSSSKSNSNCKSSGGKDEKEKVLEHGANSPSKSKKKRESSKYVYT